jgi:hypothetical protein
VVAGNFSGVKVVLLIGYSYSEKSITLEKWTSMKVDRGTRSSFVDTACCSGILTLSWKEDDNANPFDFSVVHGSNDPLLIATAAEVLNDITIAPSKNFVISSHDVQRLVERVYRSL